MYQVLAFDVLSEDIIGTKKKLVNSTEDGPKKFIKFWPKGPGQDSLPGIGNAKWESSGTRFKFAVSFCLNELDFPRSVLWAVFVLKAGPSWVKLTPSTQ